MIRALALSRLEQKTAQLFVLDITVGSNQIEHLLTLTDLEDTRRQQAAQASTCCCNMHVVCHAFSGVGARARISIRNPHLLRLTRPVSFSYPRLPPFPAAHSPVCPVPRCIDDNVARPGL